MTILLAWMTQAHVMLLMANHISDMQHHKNTLAHTPFDESVDMLVERALESLPFHQADLEKSTVAKTGPDTVHGSRHTRPQLTVPSISSLGVRSTFPSSQSPSSVPHAPTIFAGMSDWIDHDAQDFAVIWKECHARAIAKQKQEAAGAAVTTTTSKPMAASTGAAPRRLALDEDADLGDWCAMFINLARRTDRLKNLTNLLAYGNAHLLGKLQRIDAVDGRLLHLNDTKLHCFATERALVVAQKMKDIGRVTVKYDEGGLVSFSNHLTTGAVACAMSHHAALQTLALHPTAEWALILEDDLCAVVPNVHRVIARMLSCMKSQSLNWHAILLGYHGGSFAVLEDEPYFSSPYVPPWRRLEAEQAGLYAWIVRKEIAREMVAPGTGVYPIEGQVDHAITGWLLQKKKNIYMVDYEHKLFDSPRSEDLLDSDIQTLERWNPPNITGYGDLMRFLLSRVAGAAA